MTPRKILGGLGLLSASFSVLAGTAFAEELKIFDQTGTLRSAADLKAGETANIKITVTGTSKNAATTVALEDSAKHSLIQSAPVNDQGVAVFKDVASGAVNVKPSAPGATIANVEIMRAPAQQGLNSDADKTQVASKSIYVAGASAVAGALGVSLANSDGSSNGTSATGGTSTVKGSDATNNGNVTGAFPNADGSADDVLGTSAFAAPDPGNPIAAPSTITENPTVEEPNAGGGAAGIPADSAPPAPPPPPPPSISGS